MSEPKISHVGTTISVSVEYLIQDSEALQEAYGRRPARIDPRTVVVRVEDGEITLVRVTGPRILKSGKTSGDYRISYGCYGIREDAPEWLRTLAERARLAVLIES